MKTEKHACCGNVFRGGYSHYTSICGKNAKFERDGKWYCGTHDPVAKKEKAAIRYAEWDAKYEARRASEKAAEKARKEKEAKAEMFGQLLEALRLCYDHCRLYYPEVGHNNVGESVRAAIAKAEAIK